MRERLVTAFVGLAVVLVGLYGIPRAYFLADLVREQEQTQVDRTAALVSVAIGERGEDGETVNRAFLDRLAVDGEQIVLKATDGQTITTSNRMKAQDGDVWATRVVVGGAGAVTVTRSADEVNEQISSAVLPLVLLGLLLIVLAGVAGFVMSRWLSRPFQELAGAARGIGAGRLKQRLPRYRMPEAREIATALTTSGAKIDALLQHERDLAVHASHELRTPVTALRLELEDLALWPETPPSVAEALNRSVGELDRLSAAIGELLSATQVHSAEAEIDLDLDALVADTVARLQDAGTTVTHTRTGSLPTHLDPLPVIKALELLLDDTSHVTTADRGSHLEIVILADTVTTPVAEGVAQRPSREPRSLPGGASDLIAAAGGQLTQDGPRVVLRLPKRALTH